jgi:hypothetical protein
MYTIYPGGKNVSADGEQKELFFENRGTKFENFSEGPSRADAPLQRLQPATMLYTSSTLVHSKRTNRKLLKMHLETLCATPANLLPLLR